MISVVVDGSQEKVSTSEYANLREVVEEYGARLTGRGRVVIHVALDGDLLNEDQFEAMEDIGVDDSSLVKIDSEDAVEVAIGSLESCGDYCGSIGNALLDAVDLLRTGRVQEGSEFLVDLSDSFEVLVAGVCGAMHLLGPKGEELEELPKELLQWIESVVEAQVATDWVRVSDYLEFEIAPLMARWEARLKAIRRSVQLQ